MTSFKADEGSVLLKMRQFIWMPSYELRALNLSPAFAIWHRVLVLSQTLHFCIFIGTMPPSAEVPEFARNSTDRTLTEWQQSTEILQVVSNWCCPIQVWRNFTQHLQEFSKKIQQQCPLFFSKRPLCCLDLSIMDF